MSRQPLTSQQLEAYLDDALDAVLSSRRTAAEPAQSLAHCSRDQQDFALHWVGIVAKTNSELGYQFAANVHRVFAELDLPWAERWIVRAMDIYDRQGLYPGSAALREVEMFISDFVLRPSAVRFQDLSGVLEKYVRGLAGRALRLQVGEIAHTDSETLFLPATIARFDDQHHNRALYKSMLAHLWAQMWFGTFRGTADGLQAGVVVRRYPDPERAAKLFHALETVRLDACICRELPGLGREMAMLRELEDAAPFSDDWKHELAALREPGATVDKTLEILVRLYRSNCTVPLGYCYQGTLRFDEVEQVGDRRKQNEKIEFRAALAELVENSESDRSAAGAARSAPAIVYVRETDAEPGLDGTQYEFMIDGEVSAPPTQMRALMTSIVQDFGEIPPEYVAPAGDGGYPKAGIDDKAANVWKGTYHEEGAYIYDEWDFRRKHFRKDWCVLREIDMQPRYSAFVATTLQRYAGLVREIRRTFEALRGDEKRLRRQTNGEDIDVDAVVQACADMRAGEEMSNRLFIKQHRLERDMAVVFMVDVSGSTKGWINDAERESLVLLCEALQILGDRYAIYGFSGMTRKRCELFRIKRFDESYDDQVKARIAGLYAQDYTRMGVTIRHLTKLLATIDARTRLLITLSDGKPDDYDGYRGDYGIEDTRQALIEAKHAGIHPFCITIDSQAHDYLPHMYGAVNYTVIDDVRKLPVRVSDIYRRLTT
ncbi:MAG: VWA domain-containing protein [Gammaproteobacteria bacterium]|nr:VWA domain-containing protein [Gammaproteobacteria bacterium]MDH3464302.1 VWA domain-containing protein [Gammaproteobacteria bacterium]